MKATCDKEQLSLVGLKSNYDGIN